MYVAFHFVQAVFRQLCVLNLTIATLSNCSSGFSTTMVDAVFILRIRNGHVCRIPGGSDSRLIVCSLRIDPIYNVLEQMYGFDEQSP